MDHIKMVVDNVWVKNKDPLVIGVAMIAARMATCG